MPLDLTTALNSYGFVGQLANAIPDLKSILDQAIAGEWAPEQFTRALMDSGWYRSNAESARQLIQLQATDPATYNQNFYNAQEKIYLIGRQMGRVGDYGAMNGLTYQALMNNWDDEQIRSQIGARITANQSQPGVFAGDAAQLDTHMRQLTQNFGVAMTDGSLQGWMQNIQSGIDTLDGFESLIRARAKAQFPHLAGQIDAGMTVRDIADPYIASYAQTLEIPETGIGLADPAIQKALQVKAPDGTFSTTPMYEFVRQLKDDPRWDKTKNAEDEAYRFANRLGKDMGFLS